MKTGATNGRDEWCGGARRASSRCRLAFCSLLLVFVAAFAASPQALAQRRLTREYPAQPNVSVKLLNRSGTIEVLAWDKRAVRVTATMESRSAKMEPEVNGNGVTIDVRRDNREDVGDINFRVQVPANSTVDISTMTRNITIRNV